MKLSLILLICFAGVSYQQGYAWSPFHYSPRLLFYPDYDQFIQPAKSPLGVQHEYEEDQVDPSTMTDIQARAPFGSRPQKKFFVTSIPFPSLFPFNIRTLPVTTLTTTVLSTVSSTAVVAAVQQCLPLSLFVTQAGLTTLTNACARRRRDTAEESQVEADTILPSTVYSLATTSVAANLADNYVKPEITSSQSDLGENQRQLFFDRNSQRHNRGLSMLVTTTSTITSYSFSTTTIKKTVILSGPNALSCLPFGFAVC